VGLWQVALGSMLHGLGRVCSSKMAEFLFSCTLHQVSAI
jgi:hypothetical protein